MSSNCLNFKMFGVRRKESSGGGRIAFAWPHVRCLEYGYIERFTRNQAPSSFRIQWMYISYTDRRNRSSMVSMVSPAYPPGAP